MGNASNNILVEGKWVVAADVLSEGEKKFVESKLVESESFVDYSLNLDEVMSIMHKGSFQQGDYLFKRGEVSKAMFVILKGTCDILQYGGKRIGVYNRGSVVGDTGLQTNVLRTFSVRCSSQTCDVLRLTKSSYDSLIAELKHRQDSRNFLTLSSATVLFGSPLECIRRIEQVAEEKSFYEGSVIITKEDKDKYMYVIKSGAVIETVYNGLPDTSNKGQFSTFGEEALVRDELCSHYNATVIAAEYTNCLLIDYSKLEEKLTDNVLNKISDNIVDKLKLLRRYRKDPNFLQNDSVPPDATTIPHLPPKSTFGTLAVERPASTAALLDILKNEELKDDSGTKHKSKSRTDLLSDVDGKPVRPVKDSIRHPETAKKEKEVDTISAPWTEFDFVIKQVTSNVADISAMVYQPFAGITATTAESNATEKKKKKKKKKKDAEVEV